MFLDSNLFSEEIYFFSKLPAIINYSQIVKIALISIFLSFLSTIYPSIRASKVDPINLIKWDWFVNLKKITQNYLQGDSIIKVLSGLNFSVNGVKSIGIIGPSGSGKSTFLIY